MTKQGKPEQATKKLRIRMMELGLDVSKKFFDATLLREAGKKSYKRFDNNVSGIKHLLRWLKEHGVEALHVCMEATNTYWEELAETLHGAGYKVSVVNPARIKGFAMSQMQRSKTDKIDSYVIACFCAKMEPNEWQPPREEQKKIRSLERHLQALQKSLTQHKNRLANSKDPDVIDSLQWLIQQLEEEMTKIERKIEQLIDSDAPTKKKRVLMESIPGIGAKTSRGILAEMYDLDEYKSASAAAADTGITPSHHESGDTVRRRPRISRMGKASIRQLLYFPALTAMRCNPIIIAFAKRLEARGKPKKVIITAVMRKLMHLIYGVVKNGIPFDPNYRRSTLQST